MNAIDLKGWIVVSAPHHKSHAIFVQRGKGYAHVAARCGVYPPLGWTSALPLMDDMNGHVTCLTCRRLLNL